MRRALEFDVERGVEDGDHVARVHLGPDDVGGGPAYLHVHGIATVWTLEVNGTQVAQGRSMFERVTVDVTEQLRAGDNEVRVRCTPVEEVLDAAPRRPRARWRTRLSDEHRLRWLRTSLLGRMPGLPTGPPVQGPWRPVLLETGVGPRVTSLRLRPTLSGDTGVLEVAVTVEGGAVGVDRVTVELGPVSSEVELVDGVGRARLELPEVRRWWPHTHGEPVRHPVRVRHEGRPLDLPGDGTGAADTRWVGFRALDGGTPDAPALTLNDVPVFVRGAVWTPGDLGALDRAVELGLNCVRVSGITAYESDAFHERCDELGLLVWQDLMFATFDYPLADPDLAAAVDREVRTETARLLGHPSTAVVCGSAEHEQQAAMFGVPPASGAAAELAAYLRPRVDPELDVRWVDSTPSGGLPPTRVDTGVGQYFGVGAYRRPLADARTSGVRFAAECLAFSHLADPPVEGGVPRDAGADWDFADVREHYARERYGARPSLVERQRVTGEVMADVLGEWRRPASSCAGAIVLWLRDLEPGAGWGLLDHAGRPKPAAAALAPVLQPVAVWLVDEGLNGVDVHVANDRPEPLRGELTVELVRADGPPVDTGSRAVTVPGRGHLVVGVEELIGRFADVAHVHRFGPAAHSAVRVLLTPAAGEPVSAVRRIGDPPGWSLDSTSYE